MLCLLSRSITTYAASCPDFALRKDLKSIATCCHGCSRIGKGCRNPGTRSLGTWDRLQA
jgi:hypothetical protein